MQMAARQLLLYGACVVIPEQVGADNVLHAKEISMAVPQDEIAQSRAAVRVSDHSKEALSGRSDRQHSGSGRLAQPLKFEASEELL